MIRPAGLFCFTLIVLVACHVRADEPKIDPTANPFDGKSLAAWTTPDGKPVTNGWEIVDGVIHLKKDSKGGNILTARDFGDFTLSFEWKIAKSGNSGIKYRVRNYDKKVLGLEYQVFDDDGAKKPTEPKNAAGAIYDLYEPNSQKMLKPVGEYNTAKIVVRGNHIEHWLNGKQIVTATVGDADWRKRVAESKFDNAKGFGLNRFGKFMLTDHGSEVWYRNFQFEPGPTNTMVATGGGSSGGGNGCRVGPLRRLFGSRNCRR